VRDLRERHQGRRLRAASFACCALGGLVPPPCGWAPRESGEELRFAAREGTVLIKSLSSGHELAVDELSLARDDGPPVRDEAGGWVSSWQKVSSRDEHVHVEGGRPLVLERTWLDVAAGGQIDVARVGSSPNREKSVSASPLQGRSVVLTWVEPEREWSRAWKAIDADEAWLAGVRGDMDMLALLPPRAVREGESWEVPTSALRDVLAPGGDLTLAPRGSGPFGRTMELGAGGDLADVLGETIEGSARATFTGVREADGVRLGVIALELEIASERDRSQAYLAATPAAERREASELVSASVRYRLQGRGELLWDLDAAHMRSFTLSGPETVELSVEKRWTNVPEPFRVRQTSRFSGTYQMELVARPPEPDPPEPPAAKEH
jgi:hypothetical protein